MGSRSALFVVAMAILLASLPSEAQVSPKPGYRGMPCANLDLSADQQKRIVELRGASDQKVQPLRNDMLTKSSELRQLWPAPNPDRQAIQKKQAEMDQIRQQIRDARTEHHLAMLELLTPAQREKLQAAQGSGFGPGSGARWHGRGGGRGAARSGMGPGCAL